MTDKILSQDEVDALLKGVASGEIDTDDEKGKIVSGVRPYDFMNQERIARGKMLGLEMVNDGFSRLMRNSISKLIIKYIDINVIPPVHIKDNLQLRPHEYSFLILGNEIAKGEVMMGSINNVCKLYGTPVHYITTGQKVPGNIEFFDSERLTNLILRTRSA
jgi:hypothetical protein